MNLFLIIIFISSLNNSEDDIDSDHKQENYTPWIMN